jgi:hypothetical protein
VSFVAGRSAHQWDGSVPLEETLKALDTKPPGLENYERMRDAGEVSEAVLTEGVVEAGVAIERIAEGPERMSVAAIDSLLYKPAGRGATSNGRRGSRRSARAGGAPSRSCCATPAKPRRAPPTSAAAPASATPAKRGSSRAGSSTRPSHSKSRRRAPSSSAARPRPNRSRSTFKGRAGRCPSLLPRHMRGK